MIAAGVSAFFLYLTLRGAQLDEVAKHLLGVNLAILSLTIVTKGTGFVFMALRARVLFGPIHDYRFGEMFKAILVGFAGNNLLPFRAGELLKVGYLSRVGRTSPSTCLAVVVTERLIDTFCMLLLFLAATPLAVVEVENTLALALTASVVVGAVGFVIMVARYPEVFIGLAERGVRPLGAAAADKLTPLMNRFIGGLAALRSARAVATVMLLSLGTWAMWLTGIRIWMWAFDLHLPWYAPLVVVSFVAFGSFLPSAPSGVGTYHYFCSRAFSLMGVGPHLATSLAFVGHAASTLPWTLISLAVLLVELARNGWPTPATAEG